MAQVASVSRGFPRKKRKLTRRDSLGLIEEGLTRSAIGAFYAVYNKLGYGFVENVYVGGLVIELQRRGHRTQREVPVPVEYDGILVGTYKVDLLVDDSLVIEVKAEAGLTGIHERQLRNYLRCTKLELGLILVFGLKPEFKRHIHTNAFKQAKNP
ncbi:MAG: GxxExxY protein [Gemmatimonadaceae bacterium]